MINITKATRAALSFSSKDESRYDINTVCFEPNGKQIATNGRGLIILEQPEFNQEDYPVIDGFELSQNGERILLKADDVEKAVKIVPKKSHIPILKRVVAANQKNDTLSLISTDMENTSSIQCRKELGKFPNYQLVIPPEESFKFTVRIGIEMLENIVNAARALAVTGGISFSFQESPSNAFRVEMNGPAGEKATIIAMPHRL